MYPAILLLLDFPCVALLYILSIIQLFISIFQNEHANIDQRSEYTIRNRSRIVESALLPPPRTNLPVAIARLTFKSRY